MEEILHFGQPTPESNLKHGVLTPKERAILRFADTYGFSELSAVKLIAFLRKQRAAAKVREN